MRSRRRVAVLTTGGLAATLAVTVWLVGKASTTPGAADSEVPPSTLTVTSVSVRSEQWPASFEAFGSIVPRDEMIVSAQVDGQPLLEVQANVGDRVRRGEVLARFDTARLRVEVRRLHAEVEQAEAEVAQAEAERDRAARLAEGGAVSQQEAMERLTAAHVAAAKLAASRAQLAARELDLQRADVTAPDDGTVSARNAQTGMVGTSGLELFRIIRRDDLEWRGELTAAQLARAATGQQVSLSLPGGTTARARIRRLAPAVNVETRLATVYADLEPGGPARAGTYVSGRVEIGTGRALVVPASSVGVRDGYCYAFELVGAGEARRVTEHRVEVGRRRGTDVEILAGLTDGAHVVAQGVGFLDDGDSVLVVGGADAGNRTSRRAQ